MTYTGILAWVNSFLNLQQWIGLISAPFTDELCLVENQLTIEQLYGLGLQQVIWGTPVISQCGAYCNALPLSFVANTKPPSPITIYGYAVFGNDELSAGTPLYDAFLYPNPEVITNAGDFVTVNYRLRTGLTACS